MISCVRTIARDGVRDLDGEARLVRLGEDGPDLLGPLGEHPRQLTRRAVMQAARSDDVEQVGPEAAGPAIPQRRGGVVRGGQPPPGHRAGPGPGQRLIRYKPTLYSIWHVSRMAIVSVASAAT